MNPQHNVAGPTFSERMATAWDRFWFTPADPTVLGLIRIGCGLITLYTVLAYSLSLQEFFGEDGWWDLPAARRVIKDKPYVVLPLRGFDPRPPPAAENLADENLVKDYMDKYGFDFRTFHLPFPVNEEQRKYLFAFTEKHRLPPAPPYPQGDNEDERKKDARRIDQYMDRWGEDPRRVYTRGKPAWSVWFHVTDPNAMVLVHAAFVLVTFLFTIGFCTRITAALTWMGQMSYIHRISMIQFGVDTMMAILLLYLMIGPSGAAWSLDRRMARWWSRAKPRIINRWRSFWGAPPGPVEPAQTFSPDPVPSVSANVAIRLLQIHVCIIYLAAGLSKLLGRAWWDGTAVWGTIANFEFAPMQYEIYNDFLRTLGKNQLVFTGFLTSAGYFTLFFEIGFTFLIWRPATRWVILGMAITLHGFIGLFMGLKTFSLMMLVMNMAFLRTDESRWLVGWLYWLVGLVTSARASGFPPPHTAAMGSKRRK